MTMNKVIQIVTFKYLLHRIRQPARAQQRA